MLSKHPDKCRFPHGHTRKVECVLRADTLDENEMVCDFKVVKELLGAFLDAYDHALCMNTDDPQYAHFKAVYGERVIGFPHTDPTTEILAQAVFEHLSERLSTYAAQVGQRYAVRAEVVLERVRVWETSSSWAEYWPSLEG
jgi:6-pyruvoyltetrahydropterin/6-carboxytetrahydropterin synthase